MTPAHLSALNAVLGGLSAVFVALGWWAIRRQQEQAHALCLIVATVISVAFLAGDGALIIRLTSVPHLHPPPLTYVYAALLVSHVVSALAWPVLLTAAYIPVWRQRWNVHRRVGKLAVPVWLFVLLTGVLVNVLLPAPA